MVTFWQAVVLGVLQGLTEFLPVSSSGHLVIGQALLGMEAEVLSFDIFVHVGTLVAVFAVFWGDIVRLLRHPFNKTVGLIILGCVPAGLMGFLLNDLFTSLFSSLVAVGCALIVTGVLLFISDRFQGQRQIRDLNAGQALLVGLFQGLAITPGLSRSGSTIFGALLCGLKRSEAAKFSFLLSIPVILGAALKQVLDMRGGEIVFQSSYLVGFVVAAVCGYLAIRVFLKLLENKSLRYFSYYCWVLAIIVLLTQIF